MSDTAGKTRVVRLYVAEARKPNATNIVVRFHRGVLWSI